MGGEGVHSCGAGGEGGGGSPGGYADEALVQVFLLLGQDPWGQESSWKGAVGAAPQAVPRCTRRTLVPLAVVGPEGFVTGDVRVEEEQRVLGDVLLRQQLVITDDVGQRQRRQLGCGVGDDSTEGGGSYGGGGRSAVGVRSDRGGSGAALTALRVLHPGAGDPPQRALAEPNQERPRPLHLQQFLFLFAAHEAQDEPGGGWGAQSAPAAPQPDPPASRPYPSFQSCFRWSCSSARIPSSQAQKEKPAAPSCRMGT